jgi:hypothetical protein
MASTFAPHHYLAGATVDVVEAQAGDLSGPEAQAKSCQAYADGRRSMLSSRPSAAATR